MKVLLNDLLGDIGQNMFEHKLKMWFKPSKSPYRIASEHEPPQTCHQA